MKTSIQALREQLNALSTQANHMLDSKPKGTKWTAEDQTAFDALGTEMQLISDQIATAQRIMDISAEENFSDIHELDTRNTVAVKVRDLVAKLLRDGPNALTADEHRQFKNTMSTTTPSEGGYSVQSEVAKEYIDLQKSFGFMRKVAEQFTTTSGGPLGYPTSDGTSETGELVLQNVQASSADIVMGTRDLTTHKFGSKIITIPIELIQDTQIDLVGLVFKRIRERIGRSQNGFFTTGTGTAQPTGIVPACSVAKIGTTGQTLTIIYDDLVDMVDGLDTSYLDDAVIDPATPNAAPGWMMSQTMRRVIRKLKDTTGRPIWTPGYEDGISAATPDRLMGYPVYINNDMAVPAANAKSLLFGNLNKYMIRDAMDISLFRFDDSVYTSKGQVGFLGWARSGGNLMDIKSVVAYQHSAT